MNRTHRIRLRELDGQEHELGACLEYQLQLGFSCGKSPAEAGTLNSLPHIGPFIDSRSTTSNVSAQEAVRVPLITRELVLR